MEGGFGQPLLNGLPKINQVGEYDPMEKRTPHGKLSIAKSFIEAGKVRTTHAARAGADALGFDYSGMLAVVLGLGPGDFYKSMTTCADHRI